VSKHLRANAAKHRVADMKAQEIVGCVFMSAIYRDSYVELNIVKINLPAIQPRDRIVYY